MKQLFLSGRVFFLNLSTSAGVNRRLSTKVSDIVLQYFYAFNLSINTIVSLFYLYLLLAGHSKFKITKPNPFIFENNSYFSSIPDNTYTNTSLGSLFALIAELLNNK